MPESGIVTVPAETVFEHADVILFCIAVEARGIFRFETANRAFLTATGLKKSQVLGKLVAEVIPAASHDLVLKKYRQAVRTKQTVTWEESTRYPAGMKHGKVSATPVCDAKGKVTRLAGMVHDITARKETEAALRESEERYRRAVHGTHDGLWDWDLATGNAYLSPRWKSILGYQEQELKPHADTFFSLIHLDDVPRVSSAIQAHFKKRVPYDMEFRMRAKDGTWRWIRSRGEAERDAKRKPVRMAGAITDIAAQKLAKEALRASEERFRRVFEQAAVGVAIVDNKTGRYVQVNDRFCEIAGRSKAQMTATTFMAITHPEDLKTSAQYNKDIRTGRVAQVEFEKRFVRPDGSIVWAHLATSPLWQPGEAPSLNITLATDITERKKVEKALRESEERYRLLADHTYNIVSLSDVHGNILYISPSFFRKSGWTLADLKRRSWRTRVHPADLTMIERARDANLTGKATEVEYRMLCRDGSTLWMESNCKPIRDKAGKVWRLLVWSHDITGHKLAEERIKQEQEFNQALVNHASLLIVVLDAKARILHVNQTAAEGLGRSQAELLGRTPWECGLMDKQETERSKQRFRDLVQGGAAAPVEIRLRTKGGEWRHVELRSTTIQHADGTIDRVIITATDLTERLRMQQEVLRISEQEHARIGHDLHDGVGQTMTGVASLLEALEQELEGDAKRSASRIRELLQEAIQDVRRMSHGLSPAAVRHRELGGALQLLADTIRGNFRTACICEVAGDIRIKDPEKQMHLFRIAQEAVNNALRHGGPQCIKLGLERGSEGEYVMKIEDNGCGMAKRKQKSDGIGLRVMDYRAKLIGGSLQVKNGRRSGVSVICRFRHDA